MGSGLILLVLVGAWLAVLVPMGLRRHDSAVSLRSTDRFGDAMRVLSRRPHHAERTVLAPRRGVPITGAPAPGRTLAERRRRTLFALLGVAGLAAVAGLLGPRLLLVPAALTAVLAVLFVVHCRRQAQLRAERLRRRAAASPGLPRQRGPRVAGVPDRMPPRPAPLSVPLPAPAARYDEPVPVHVPAAAGPAWSPVPVPLPGYVAHAAAPTAPRRVLDLTRPGRWSAGLADDDSALTDDSAELDEILDRRRAVGDW